MSRVIVITETNICGRSEKSSALRNFLTVLSHNKYDIKVIGTIVGDFQKNGFVSGTIENKWAFTSNENNLNFVTMRINNIEVHLLVVNQSEIASNEWYDHCISDHLASILKYFDANLILLWGARNSFAKLHKLIFNSGRKVVLFLTDTSRIDFSVANCVHAVICPSYYISDYWSKILTVSCTTYPFFLNSLLPKKIEKQYVVFTDPSLENGLSFFAHIAYNLGQHRPDIQFLLVQSRKDVKLLRQLDSKLAEHGNVFQMDWDAEDCSFWDHAAFLVFPTLSFEGINYYLNSAIYSGFEIIVSDRTTHSFPNSNAVTTLHFDDSFSGVAGGLLDSYVREWSDKIIELWDLHQVKPLRTFVSKENNHHQELDFFIHLDSILPKYVNSESNAFTDGHFNNKPPATILPNVVLVPYMDTIHPECESALRKLEMANVTVIRRGGSSAIDLTRNIMISDALHNNWHSILFVDSDLGFDYRDALRLFALPQPIVSGVYAKKGQRGIASIFQDGITEVLFGSEAPYLYPLKYAATGFLRVQTKVLVEMIAKLDLPLCNVSSWNSGIWPFFLPMIVLGSANTHIYLAEDWAFSHRLSQIGITPFADTSIRLFHYGNYGYGWEDAGSHLKRYNSYNYSKLAD